MNKSLLVAALLAVAPKAAPAPAPTQQVDCTLPQNKALAVCRPAK